ncbi:MAG TPA: copper uptake system-associated protein [Bradyrhizobium sp.]|nr:copper uptake system-associated protein [Bradyrhizobium sp.]
MCHLMKLVRVATVGTILVFVSPTFAETSDQAAVVKLLHGMFDRPGAALLVAPVVVSGSHAVAGWTQGETGGRALLRKKDRDWVLILCAGDGIKSRDGLVKAGVPSADAALLARDMISEEAKLPAQQVAMFSRFEGIMMMESGGARGPDAPAGH